MKRTALELTDIKRMEMFKTGNGLKQQALVLSVVLSEYGVLNVLPEGSLAHFQSEIAEHAVCLLRHLFFNLKEVSRKH